MVTLELDAGSIEFTTNLGEGEIIAAAIENFQSQSGNGKFVGVVKNTASFSAEFVLAFHCSSNV